MPDFDFYLQKVAEFHGHVCAGIILGTRMTLAAMQALKMNPLTKNKSLIVFVETDRCMTDAVQVLTGCSLGHRSLKHIDYGKFAATFVNLDTHQAVRASIKESFDSHGEVSEVTRKVAQLPDNEIVILQEVKVEIPDTDLPGSPVRRAYCSVCGERIVDGREILKEGNPYCRGCAGERYYTVKK